MEIEESVLQSDYSERNRQKLISCSKRDGAENLDKNNIAPAVTEQDLLQMFDNNEEHLRYYLSLKEVVLEKRRKGEICWCDPRDLQMKERLELSKWKPRIVFKLGSDLDSSEDKKYALSSKQVALDKNGQDKDVEDESGNDPRQEPDCSSNEMENEPNNTSFESHYHTCHNYVCAECKRIFVSNFLLDIHLQENHDSYFKILSPKIDMYRCLVESCKQKFRTPEQRQAHVVEVHKLPAKFSFHQPIQTKSKNSQTTSKSALLAPCIIDNNNMNSSEISSLPFSQTSTNMEVEASGHQMPETVGATKESGRGSSSKGRGSCLVPRTICFGRGSLKAFKKHRPGGKKQHWHQMGVTDVDATLDIEEVDFTDMIESLDNI